jgi:DMSO/TMAO reductase YedYZ molybdopterin-dependent catalytic subunit
MKHAFLLLLPFIALACTSTRASSQSPNGPPPQAAGTLTVTGEVSKPLALTHADLASMSRMSVRARDHDGKEYLFSGIALADILVKAGAPMGPKLRAKQMATYLLVKAKDGYQVVFALPELDSAFTDRTIILADEVDGQPLPADKGPYRLVVPGEKKHARWIWGVTGMVVKKADEDNKAN